LAARIRQTAVALEMWSGESCGPSGSQDFAVVRRQTRFERVFPPLPTPAKPRNLRDARQPVCFSWSQTANREWGIPVRSARRSICWYERPNAGSWVLEVLTSLGLLSPLTGASRRLPPVASQRVRLRTVDDRRPAATRPLSHPEGGCDRLVPVVR